MRIDFLETRENKYLAYYAVSQDVVYRGKLHDEIMWCEMKVNEVTGETTIIWEDAWQYPERFGDLMSAKVHVTKMYIKHTGYENGNSYPVN